MKQGSICLICSEVKEVVQLHGCGHALCVQCWRNLLEIFVPQASSPLFTGEEWAALLSCPVEQYVVMGCYHSTSGVLCSSPALFSLFVFFP